MRSLGGKRVWIRMQVRKRLWPRMHIRAPEGSWALLANWPTLYLVNLVTVVVPLSFSRERGMINNSKHGIFIRVRLWFIKFATSRRAHLFLSLTFAFIFSHVHILLLRYFPVMCHVMLCDITYVPCIQIRTNERTEKNEHGFVMRFQCVCDHLQCSACMLISVVFGATQSECVFYG